MAELSPLRRRTESPLDRLRLEVVPAARSGAASVGLELAPELAPELADVFRRPTRAVLAFMIQNHRHGTRTHCRRKPHPGLLLLHSSILSRVGASGKPGTTLRPLPRLLRRHGLVLATLPRLAPWRRSVCSAVPPATPTTSARTSHRRRPSRDPLASLALRKASHRQAPPQGTPSRRMLHQQAQVVPPHRHPLRQNRQELPDIHHSRRHRIVVAMTVNRI